MADLDKRNLDEKEGAASGYSDEGYLDDEEFDDGKPEDNVMPESDNRRPSNNDGYDHSSERSSGKKDIRKKKKKKKWIKWLIIAVIAAAVIVFFMTRKKDPASGFSQETVKRRDITTYHSFTGNITPDEYKNVLPDVSGVKISSVEIEEGDDVKEGDVIMTLDKESIEKQISQLQAQMNTAANSSAISIEQAQQNYSQYKQNLDDGLDSQIQGAKSGMDSAYSQLVSAQQSFNTEVQLNNDQKSQTIMSAIQGVDSAYYSYQSALLRQSQLEEQINYSEDNTDVSDYENMMNSQNKDTAQLNVDQAKNSYDSALAGYEAAKINEESNLTRLFDSLISAQESYLNAVDSYAAAVRASEQNLDKYSMQIRQAQAGADQQASEVQMENLKDQLDDCSVKAPISGTVTALNVQEGDFAAAGTPLATITNFDKMKIDIKINEYDILGVHEGSPVTINIDALDKDYEGTISKISRVATIENGVSYFKSEVQFNGDDDARSGMSAEVRLTVYDEKNVCSISSAAIQTAEDGSSYVYVMGDKNKLTQKPVITGISDGTYTEISRGLSDGDIIYYMPSMSEMYQMMMGGHAASRMEGGEK